MTALEKSEEEQVLEIIVRNQLTIKELQEENDKLKSFFRSSNAYPVGTRREVGKFYIQVTANKRVDDKLAREILSEAHYKRYSKQVIDGPLAKANLNSETYGKIQKNYENKVEIGLV